MTEMRKRDFVLMQIKPKEYESFRKIFGTKATEAFIEVVNSHGFTAAAQKLNVSQPLISTQIKRLEKQVGVTLIKGRHGAISLTDEGELFFQAIMNLHRIGMGYIDGISRKQDQRTITIGINHSFDVDRMDSVILAMKTKYPQITIDLKCLKRKHLLSALHDNELDLALMYFPYGTPLPSSLAGISKVSTEEFTLIQNVRGKHNEWITYSDSEYVNLAIEGWFVINDVVNPDIKSGFDTPGQVLKAVELQGGRAFVPSSLIRRIRLPQDVELVDTQKSLEVQVALMESNPYIDDKVIRCVESEIFKCFGKK